MSNKCFISSFTSAIFLIILILVADAQSISADKFLKIPFTIKNNHIYLRGRINNSKLLWFLLDTGSGTIINHSIATSLGIKLRPSQKTYGVGEGASDVSIAENVSFRLSEITISEKEIAVVSLQNVVECAAQLIVDKKGNVALKQKPLAKENYQPIDAVLGGNFFKAFVVEIDYEKKIIHLYDPKTYYYSGKGNRIPIEIKDYHIFTEALVTVNNGNVKGRFMIDCGSMVAVILNEPFIEKHNLLPPSNQTKPFDVCGIGGNSKTRVGTLQSILIQKISIKKPPVLFSKATTGVLSSTNFDGSIGNAILRRFKVTFDYSHKQMILE